MIMVRKVVVVWSLGFVVWGLLFGQHTTYNLPTVVRPITDNRQQTAITLVILKKPLRAGSERISSEKETFFYPRASISTRRFLTVLARRSRRFSH